MTALAVSEGPVVSSINALDAGADMPSHCVLRQERTRQEMGLEKGKTPVKVGKMFAFLNRYLDRESARLLGEGFSWVLESLAR